MKNLSICLSFNNVFEKQVPTPDVTNPVSLPFFLFIVGRILLFHFTLCKYVTFNTIGRTDFLHPSAAQIKTSQISIYLPSQVSAPHKSIPKMYHFINFFPKLKKKCW